MTNLSFQKQRRIELANLWELAFQEARDNNRPPRHDMSNSFVELHLTAAMLMYSAMDIGSTEEFLAMEKFMDLMNVGGYRMGRKRNGGVWASIFVRNVQYTAMKYVPRTMKVPELILMTLACRANMKEVSQWVADNMVAGQNLPNLNRRGVTTEIQHTAMRVVMRVSYKGFTHSVAIEEFLEFFERNYDGDFRGDNIPERGRPDTRDMFSSIPTLL